MERRRIAAGEPFSERRRLPRLKVAMAVQFRNILKPQEPFASALTHDLSAEGLGLRKCPSSVTPEARVVMLLSLPRMLKPVRMIARVVWVDRQRASALCHCGLQVIEISCEDRDTIARWVAAGMADA